MNASPGSDNKSENKSDNQGYVSKDPRFVPFNALVHYDTDSDVNTIDRVYGTVTQKIRYPEIADLFTMGVAGVPKAQYIHD